MLLAQAEKTRDGVRALTDWLKMNDLTVPPEELARIEQEADDMRHDMERFLLEAFSTPFDRQDIYSISRQMDYILNFCLSTAIEMRAFGVHPDEAALSMADSLEQGIEKVKEAIGIMAKDPAKADAMIREMRRSERDIEVLYVASPHRGVRIRDPPRCDEEARGVSPSQGCRAEPEHYDRHTSSHHRGVGIVMFKAVDLSKKMGKEEYKKVMPDLKLKLGELQRQAHEAGLPVIIVFEGWDAASMVSDHQPVPPPSRPPRLFLLQYREARSGGRADAVHVAVLDADPLERSDGHL